MLNLKFTRARTVALFAAAMVATATHAMAQSVTPESPGNALSRHIRVLAASPREFNALIGAGRAALDLGDVQAAAGFFGRAEEVNPNAPAAKVGLGAAMAHMGDADGAIYYFDQAVRLGASPLTMALDRGLARDLNGDLRAAQGDYRLAIQSLNSDEARRRLALSLAIGRDRQGALDAIQPLLNRRDAGAQRARAFVLALVGDQIAAAQAIEAVMPGGSSRFAPFFRFLPNLTVAEKAAAVHLGIFPDNAATRIAQADRPAAPAIEPAQGSPLVATASASPPKTVTPEPPPVRVAARGATPPVPAPSFSLPSQQATASPSFSLPPATSAPPAEVNVAQSDPADVQAPIAENSSTMAAAKELAVEETAEEGNLTGIDKLLSAIEEAPPPPPAPRPKVETTKVANNATSTKAAKAAADKKVAEKKAREEKLAAEKKAREEAVRLGVKGTYWVQLAGGSNQDRMVTEYKKLSTQAGSVLKSRSGYVTEGKSYYRLLVGPFDTKSESQAFVNKLAKEGVDGFSWTRTPSQIKIEKLSSR